ncbi:unnamed protein product [Arctogadus glacialis]
MFVEAPDGKYDHRKVQRQACFRCGVMDPLFNDSPKIIDKDNGRAGWQFAPSREVTMNHPRGGGGRGHSHRRDAGAGQVQGGARPVAQSSANTPRHDSSTSDIMKLQTMGGPPEELRNGLLDDTRRQSSRTPEWWPPWCLCSHIEVA